MRNLLITVALLAGCATAQGQGDYRYRYWFDGRDDAAVTVSGLAAGIDAGMLTDNMHTLYMQVADGQGVWSSPVARLFVKTPAEGGPQLVYWFDREGARRTLTAAGGGTALDAAGLSEGFHTLQVQALGTSPSAVRQAMFMKTLGGGTPFTYWFDNDTRRDTLTGSGQTMIDVAGLTDGYHTVQMQIAGNSPSTIHRDMFIKIPQTEGIDSMACLFFVDSLLYRQELVATHDGVINWTFDATGITYGLHKAQTMIVTPSGAASSLQESFFLRVASSAEVAAMRCYYSIDGGLNYEQAATTDGHTFHFDVDASSLGDGLHRLLYFLAGDGGLCSNVMSAFFVKTPVGGGVVVQYDYWLNDGGAEPRSVVLAERENPLQLVELLDVEERPIRSKCFHFAVEESRPMVYAVNDFHIRFHNTYGRTVEDSARFVDTRVSREVTGAFALTDLEGTIASQTPPADSIVWYTIEGLAGDSLALRADRECTLHVFSPVGDELYVAGGADSKEFGGCGLALDGTYYVALHDVAGDGGATVNLDYVRFTDGGSGIAGVEAADGSSEPVNVYDASGRLVRARVAMGGALEGLQPGVYIIKDKKYLVK